MKVTICTTDGDSVSIGDMPGDDILAMLDDWRHGDSPVLQLALDDDASTYIARRHIVRIDVDD